MFEINGKCGTAKCYAEVIEDSAVEQIKNMLDMPFTEGQPVAIMPDAHTGKGCTIGTTMKVKDKVCPNLVGIDLGCGMLCINLGIDNIDLEKLDEICNNVIPSGFDVWESRTRRFNNLSNLTCYRHLKDTKRIERSIGSLGGGNHFIEVDRGVDGNLYLVIHSGSRNLGLQVAEFHQSVAVSLHEGEDEYLRKKNEIIRTYKEQGRRNEIQSAISELNKQKRECDCPKDLAWLYDEWFDDYISDVIIAQEFAVINRETIAEEICDRMNIDPFGSFCTIHNYINTDDMILRKGAIAANEGERVIIPLNMRDGSIIGVGKGNPEWNNSGPHGAGRLMSRSAARESLSFSEYKEQMSGVYTTSVCEDTIDEAPNVYKSSDQIIKLIEPTVDVEEVVKPIYNYKAHR